MRRDWLIGVVLAALVLGVYWPVRTHSFVAYDDPQFITENPIVRSGLTWNTVEYAFSRPLAGNWHPLTTLSHALDCELFGINAGAHHLVNAFLHALNAALLFFVLQQLTRKWSPRQETGGNAKFPGPVGGGWPDVKWLNLFVAVVFALHPLRVESVAWIAERKDVLSGFFFLTTLYLYGRFVERKVALHKRATDALTTHESQRTKAVERGAAPEDLSRASGNAQSPRTSSVVAISAPRSAGWNRSVTSSDSKGSPGIWYTLALLSFLLGLMSKPMLVTLPFVLMLLDFWPLERLRACFKIPGWGPAPGFGVPPSGGFGVGPPKGGTPNQILKQVLSISTFKSQFSSVKSLFYEKLPFLALSFAASLATLRVQKSSGAMQFLQEITWPDRLSNAVTSYLRYLGKLFWPADLAIVYPHPASHYLLKDAWPGWEIAFGALLLVLISVLCLVQARQRAYLAVGWFWFLGMLVPVIGLVQVGEQAMADRYTYLSMIGPVIALAWWGNEMMKSLRMPAKLFGLVATLIVLAGLTRHQLAYWQNTVTLFEHAIAVTADNPSAQFAAGVGLEEEGQTNKAMVRYRVAVAIDPHYAKAYYNMGQVFRKEGNWQAAAQAYIAAARWNPSDVPTQLNLANVLTHLARNAEAIVHYERALELDPNSVEGLNNLAWLLATCPDAKLRGGVRAVQLGERACQLTDFKVPVFLGTLAAAYAEAGRFTDAVGAAQSASTLATEAGDAETATANQKLLELYRAGKAYREDGGGNVLVPASSPPK